MAKCALVISRDGTTRGNASRDLRTVGFGTICEEISLGNNPNVTSRRKFDLIVVDTGETQNAKLIGNLLVKPNKETNLIVIVNKSPTTKDRRAIYLTRPFTTAKLMRLLGISTSSRS